MDVFHGTDRLHVFVFDLIQKGFILTQKDNLYLIIILYIKSNMHLLRITMR